MIQTCTCADPNCPIHGTQPKTTMTVGVYDPELAALRKVAEAAAPLVWELTEHLLGTAEPAWGFAHRTFVERKRDAVQKALAELEKARKG